MASLAAAAQSMRCERCAAKGAGATVRVRSPAKHKARADACQAAAGWAKGAVTGAYEARLSMV